MPRGPKGEKRSVDAIGNAIMIAKIATGEIEHHGKTARTPLPWRWDVWAARAEGMAAKRRKETAKKAAAKR